MRLRTSFTAASVPLWPLGLRAGAKKVCCEWPMCANSSQNNNNRSEENFVECLSFLSFSIVFFE
eukprot:m.153088 g.153088  ORF g.153088 m.153088 type:complete len:64 (-) comp20745_c7_seq1:797-988(-)